MKTLIIIFGAKYTIIVLDNLHKAFLISRIKHLRGGKQAVDLLLLDSAMRVTIIHKFFCSICTVFMKHPNKYTHTQLAIMKLSRAKIRNIHESKSLAESADYCI